MPKKTSADIEKIDPTKITYTVAGLSQEALIRHGLDARDAIVLEWLYKALAAPLVKHGTEKDHVWISRKMIMVQVPILQISTDRIGRLFRKYIDKGLLTRITEQLQNQNGSRSYYAFGPNFRELFFRNIEDQALSLPCDKDDQALSLPCDKGEPGVKDNAPYSGVNNTQDVITYSGARAPKWEGMLFDFINKTYLAKGMPTMAADKYAGHINAIIRKIQITRKVRSIEETNYQGFVEHFKDLKETFEKLRSKDKFWGKQPQGPGPMDYLFAQLQAEYDLEKGKNEKTAGMQDIVRGLKL